MGDFSNFIGTQQLSINTTETSGTLQKTLYLLVNNEKRLLKLGENTIGRAEDSDICFNVDTVSYNHAIIECEPNDFYIKDLRSTNYTKKDGKFIKPYVVYELKSGAHLLFGNVAATFHAIDDEETTDQENVSLSLITEEKDDVTGLSFITEEEEVITESSAINQSMSLLDTSALPQAPEVVAPTPATVQIKAGTLLESASKWDGLKLPPLDFTDENKPVADDGSSTDSEFEFFKSKPSPTEDVSNVNAKTRDLNNSMGSESAEEVVPSIHDLDTQAPSTSTRQRTNIYELETQNSPPTSSKNIYTLETQMSPPREVPQKKPNHQKPKNQHIHDLETQENNIYELETQNSPPARSKKQNIYDSETQAPQTSKKDIYALETQMSPPSRCRKKDGIYNLETQASEQQDIHDLETQAASPAKSNTGPKIYDLETQRNTCNSGEMNDAPNANIENIHDASTDDEKQTNARKKAKRNPKSNEVDTSDDEVTDRIKAKKRKKPGRPKRGKTSPRPSEGSSTDFEDNDKPKENAKEVTNALEDIVADVSKEDESSVVENSVNENVGNETNSESFIGMVGRKRKAIVSSSSETELSDNETRNKNLAPKMDNKSKSDEGNIESTAASETQRGNAAKLTDKNSQANEQGTSGKTDAKNKHESQEISGKVKNKATKDVKAASNNPALNATYDIVVQNSIDDLYQTELEEARSQGTEESQFIHEVNTQALEPVAKHKPGLEPVVKEKPGFEPLESQFSMSGEEEEEGDGSSNLLHQESQSILDQDTAEVEASSKNTTNYELSEMELDSVLSGPEAKDGKAPNKKVKPSRDSMDSSSLLFSVSETEMRPDFVQEEDEDQKSAKPKKNVTKPVVVNEDSSTTSDFEAFDAKRKEKQSKNCDVKHASGEELVKGSPTTSVGPKPKKLPIAKDQSKDSEKNDGKSSKAARKGADKTSKAVGNVKNVNINDSDSDEEITNNADKKKTTKKKVVKKTRKGTRRKASSENSDTESDFEFESHKKHDTIQANGSEDGSDVRHGKPRGKPVRGKGVKEKCVEPDDAPTHKAAAGSSVGDDFFDAPTQKVNDDQTDESFVAPTQKASRVDPEFFEAATQKVGDSDATDDELFTVPSKSKKPVNADFFEMATQKVVGPSDTDDSFIAPTQKAATKTKRKEITEEFFEMATQKVSTETNEDANDDFFEMPTQQVRPETNRKEVTEEFFEMATQKVSVGTSDEEIAPTQKNPPAKGATQKTASKRKVDEDFFDMATQKVGEVEDDFFEAPTQKVGPSGVGTDFFEAATQKNCVEQSDVDSPIVFNDMHDSDEDFFNAATPPRLKEMPARKPAKASPEAKGRGLRNRRKNDSESSSFSFDGKEVERKVNVRNRRQEPIVEEDTNMKKQKVDVKNKKREPVKEEEEVSIGKHKLDVKEKRGRKRIANATEHCEPGHQEHPDHLEEKEPKSRKLGTKQNAKEKSPSKERDIIFKSKPVEKTTTPVKKETRVRKKNPKYEDSEPSDDVKKEEKQLKGRGRPKKRGNDIDEQELFETDDENAGKTHGTFEQTTKAPESIAETDSQTKRSPRGRGKEQEKGEEEKQLKGRGRPKKGGNDKNEQELFETDDENGGKTHETVEQTTKAPESIAETDSQTKRSPRGRRKEQEKGEEEKQLKGRGKPKKRENNIDEQKLFETDDENGGKTHESVEQTTKAPENIAETDSQTKRNARRRGKEQEKSTIENKEHTDTKVVSKFPNESQTHPLAIQHGITDTLRVELDELESITNFSGRIVTKPDLNEDKSHISQDDPKSKEGTSKNPKRTHTSKDSQELSKTKTRNAPETIPESDNSLEADFEESPGKSRNRRGKANDKDIEVPAKLPRGCRGKETPTKTNSQNAKDGKGRNKTSPKKLEPKVDIVDENTNSTDIEAKPTRGRKGKETPTKSNIEDAQVGKGRNKTSPKQLEPKQYMVDENKNSKDMGNTSRRKGGNKTKQEPIKVDVVYENAEEKAEEELPSSQRSARGGNKRKQEPMKFNENIEEFKEEVISSRRKGKIGNQTKDSQQKNTEDSKPVEKPSRAKFKTETEKVKSESQELPSNLELTISRRKAKGSSEEVDGKSSEEVFVRGEKRGAKKQTSEDGIEECSARKRVKKEEGESEERNKKGRPVKDASKSTSVSASTKRKDPPAEVTPMNPPTAPCTPKKKRAGKEVANSSTQPETPLRSSPRSRGRPAAAPPGGPSRGRSASSSSESAASDSTTASARRQKLSRNSMKNEIKVTFTMIDNPNKYSSILASLHASITDNPVDSDILVTKKVARSLKFLQFLAMGKPIVSLSWLIDSERCQKFVPHEKYILRDPTAEKTYGFNLARSIQAAKLNKLLDNYSVFVTSSVKPTPADMKGIIESSGGTFFSKAPAQWPPYAIIVTDPSDSAQLKKLLAVGGAKPSVVNKEFILSGVLQQKLDFVKFKL